MKRVLSLLILTAAFFAGCDKDFSGTVDPAEVSPSVTSLSAIGTFRRTPEDSVITIKLQLTRFSSVTSVRAEIYNPLNNRVQPFPLSLHDDGSFLYGDQTALDGIFTNRITLGQSQVNGLYRIEYYLTLSSGESRKAGSESFIYDNGAANIAPVINRIIAPDTITVTGVFPFILAAEVADSNGSDDIERVYFQTYRPDGSTNGFLFEMNDRGIEGDATAGDGIWSRGIKVDSTNQKGTYRFEFKARDRGKLNSTPVNYFITIR
ncbi:MAG: hypothetical protein L6Q47_00855 [Ignavibacteriaceae bacterium]|nr:hypothetical protein [Ignavibacteriaceae bacterium]